MMNISTLTCLLAMTLLSAVSQLHAQQMKVASVDVRKIFDQWDFSKESEQEIEDARIALERESNERLAVINELKMERSKMRQQYQASSGSFTAEDKAAMDRKFMALGRDAFALEQDRNDFIAKAKRSLDREVTATSKLILDQITEAVQAYAEKEEYDMVIETGGHTTRNVPFFVHLEGAEDITDIIIEQLNAKE
ncbi:OmpH family outer membrane protein [Verrucomicrobiaceae bacterium R5-34]|uniref:OmpH family outer membrane protein n=1 Tax=Oceaniferula flava TaxID=2800421 RepID=A0AAE2SG88_9BACT|nr:OmpH family outer membrane protein [Oceaniferula flavus]MBK1830970.1 OmpH family outer membrane protein [Verrucomicrobiaceae bacterium R5-34]MBK1855816.1 OmpH family outer membrane protein [Oceaniferula flavus]MBM1137123.1 OmpH family outer membrane protein [Oceaniferula flavus]